MPETALATLAPDRHPWDRQPRETEKQYVAFQAFLGQQPPRSVVGLSKELSKKAGNLYAWSSKNHWIERTNHYDAWLQRSRDAALSASREEMNTRHAQLARAMSAKVAARIQSLEPSELSPGELGRWMQVISMVERLALGEGPTTPAVEVNVGVAVEGPRQADPQYVGEVLDRLEALGIVPSPAPLPDTAITISPASQDISHDDAVHDDDVEGKGFYER